MEVGPEEAVETATAAVSEGQEVVAVLVGRPAADPVATAEVVARLR